MKTVMTSSMVAHTWAHQSQERARNASSSMSFDGPVIYSYQTPIAMLHDTPAGRVALVTSDGYSITTKSKHLSEVWRAAHGVVGNMFYVPYVGAYGGRAPRDPFASRYYGEPRGEYDNANGWHALNVKYLVDEYRKLGGTLRRARYTYHNSADSIIVSLEERARMVREYCAAFALGPIPELDPADDARVIWTARTQREAKANTPQAIAKRERARELREAREAARLEREARERFMRDTIARERFRSGVPTGGYYGRVSDEQGGALLRFDAHDDMVRTSWGAEVPAEHARKAWRLISRLYAAGEAWETNGHTLHLGPFAVNRIEADGTMRAGCHVIHKPEIEACARALGLIVEEVA